MAECFYSMKVCSEYVATHHTGHIATTQHVLLPLHHLLLDKQSSLAFMCQVQRSLVVLLEPYAASTHSNIVVRRRS